MEYKGATIKHKANVYHGGKVTSRTVITADGDMKTLGVMLPGVYHFATEAAETVDVLQGRCRVKLAEDQSWQDYQEGERFAIPAHSHFEIEVDELLDYVCHYG
jgi:uncharacterized protein YaiE (UPF0345 family)